MLYRHLCAKSETLFWKEVIRCQMLRCQHPVTLFRSRVNFQNWFRTRIGVGITQLSHTPTEVCQHVPKYLRTKILEIF